MKSGQAAGMVVVKCGDCRRDDGLTRFEVAEGLRNGIIAE